MRVSVLEVKFSWLCNKCLMNLYQRITMCHFNHLRGAVTYRYSLENALGLAAIRGSLRIRCLRKIRSHSLANLGRGNYDGYGERKGEVTLQKEKKELWFPWCP